MKVKLAKIYYDYVNTNYDDYVNRLMISNISDWEELSKKQLAQLHEFASKFNSKVRGDSPKYVILEECNNSEIFLCIDKQVAAERAERERVSKLEKQYELDKKRKEMDRKLKKELREQAQFEKLSKKFAKRQPDASGMSTL